MLAAMYAATRLEHSRRPHNHRLTHRSSRYCRYCAPPSEDDPVCCATTDYAMQSVLMQMGLKLLSVDGMVLRSIKHWVRIGTRLGPRA